MGVYAEGRVERVGRRARLAGGLAWSLDGRLGVLAEFARGEGELRVWSSRGGAEYVADAVTSFSFGRDLLAYVSRGVGFLSWGGTPRAIRGAGTLETILASPSGRAGVAAALALGVDHTLFVVMPDGAATPLERDVSEYEFSPSAKFAVIVANRPRGRELRVVPLAGGKARTLARGVTSRKLARSQDLIAFVTGTDELHRLRVADLESGGVRALGPSPGRYEWAAGAPVLAWIGGPNRALGVARPAEVLLSFADEVAAFDLSKDGSWIAYTRSLSEAGARNQLFLARVAGEATPIDIEYNVPMFAFTPDASKLVLASHCQREVEFLGQADTDLGICAVWAVRAPFSPAPSKLGIHGQVQWFKVDDRTGRVLVAEKGNRLVASWRMRDSYIDSAVDLDHVIFLPPDSNRVAYAVTDPLRAGVYVADVPCVPVDPGRPQPSPREDGPPPCRWPEARPRASASNSNAE